MGLEFSAVSRKQAATVGKVDDDHAAGFLEAVEYFQDTENGNADLMVNFPDEKSRDAFVKYARVASEAHGMRFRAVACEKGAARLVFRMESEAAYLVRKAKRDAEIADREARRAAGEPIVRGRRKAGE